VVEHALVVDTAAVAMQAADLAVAAMLVAAAMAVVVDTGKYWILIELKGPVCFGRRAFCFAGGMNGKARTVEGCGNALIRGGAGQ
jgi:hypothetical protein